MKITKAVVKNKIFSELISYVLLRDNGTALLRPMKGSLARLNSPGMEDDVLNDRRRSRYLNAAI